MVLPSASMAQVAPDGAPQTGSVQGHDILLRPVVEPTNVNRQASLCGGQLHLHGNIDAESVGTVDRFPVGTEHKAVDNVFLIERLGIVGSSGDMHRREYLLHLVDFDVAGLLLFQAQRGNSQHGGHQDDHDRCVNDCVSIALLVHSRVALGLAGTFETAFDVSFDNKVVDERSKNIHEQHRQHGTFGITGIVDANEYGNHTDKESVNVLSVRVRARLPGRWP